MFNSGFQTGEGKTSADWKLDPNELESKFNAKTKAIFLNNPNNPVGKVRSDMKFILSLKPVSF